MALFTAGNVLTAAQLNALNGFVIKTADESVTSSTTLQNDDHLLWTIATTGTYMVDAYLYGVSAANAAGDLRLGFSFPTGTMHFSGLAPDDSLAAGAVQANQWTAILSATSGTSFIAYGLSTTTLGLHLHGALTATATGTLRLIWAQFGSNVNASTLKAGSHMRVQQVA